MDEPCAFDDAVLLEYILGAAPPSTRATIEGSPPCLVAAEQLARDILPYAQILYRVTCPDPGTLVAYQERRLHDSTLQLVIHRHLAACPLCAEEYGLLGAVDAVPLAPAPSPLRRLVEAVFQAPLALPQPLRGQPLHYQTPRFAIHLRVRQATERPRAWTLRGQVRAADGLLTPDAIESIRLQPIEQPDAAPFQGSIDSQGTFRVDGLPAGAYTLHLTTVDEEIVIRRLIIGDD